MKTKEQIEEGLKRLRTNKYTAALGGDDMYIWAAEQEERELERQLRELDEAKP